MFLKNIKLTKAFRICFLKKLIERIKKKTWYKLLEDVVGESF